MGRLRIVIADTDEGYVQGLSDYISSFHSSRFEVITFTRLEFLQDFLSHKDKRSDMLLIGPELYSKDLPTEQVHAMILLTAGNPAAKTSDLRAINKYQHVEKILGDMAQIFSESQGPQTFLPGGNHKTKIVGVYSPAGGTGKTAVSLCCSILSAVRGHKVFYLNLDSLPSVPEFFERNPQKSFSRMLYYIKEKNSNLSMKLDGVKCIDTKFGIHSFSPVEHPFDLEEFGPEDAGVLLETLRAAGQYDFVFLDMDSSFNRRNSAMMRKCDCLLIVSDPQGIARAKWERLTQHLTKFPSDFDVGILERTIWIENKEEAFAIASEGKSIALPLLANFKIDGEGACMAEEGFSAGIHRILEAILEG